ncbi:Sel1 repeat-containing protein [Sphingobacterium psychroaquaticum]|uniref:Sel1 repeat-containing protein n=2 Tax=Sphingobacterium psychroaquaticum TaxID=561061 RepID=A0A1X7IEU3_9SPHI|nr:Sel1 repeat-containing protein [Sphingobacterium psychroaquaticum]
MSSKIAQMNKISILIFLLFISSFTFAQSAEELNLKSKELIQEKKIEEALPLVKKSAELGNPEAQYNYAIFLQEGIGIQKNEQEAINWHSKSSDNGFNDGHYAMMMAYGNGQGIEQNSEKAFEYALRCANNNDATCMWNVVNCYLTGNGVIADIAKFKEWIIKLAKLQNPENLSQSGNITSARWEIANFYKKGEYFEKDIYQSYLWYLIYNEYKVDFSILKQEEVIKEIKELEKSLTKSQIEKAPKDAENLLGRKLNNIGELYKNSL